MNGSYLYELPYFNKFTEKLYGHLLFTFTIFFIILGATQNNTNLAFKIWLVIFPFGIVCYEYFLKKSSTNHFFDRSKKKTIKVIKRLLVDG